MTGEFTVAKLGSADIYSKLIKGEVFIGYAPVRKLIEVWEDEFKMVYIKENEEYKYLNTHTNPHHLLYPTLLFKQKLQKTIQKLQIGM